MSSFSGNNDSWLTCHLQGPLPVIKNGFPHTVRSVVMWSCFIVNVGYLNKVWSNIQTVKKKKSGPKDNNQTSERLLWWQQWCSEKKYSASHMELTSLPPAKDTFHELACVNRLRWCFAAAFIFGNKWIFHFLCLKRDLVKTNRNSSSLQSVCVYWRSNGPDVL